MRASDAVGGLHPLNRQMTEDNRVPLCLGQKRTGSCVTAAQSSPHSVKMQIVCVAINQIIRVFARYLGLSECSYIFEMPVINQLLRGFASQFRLANGLAVIW